MEEERPKNHRDNVPGKRHRSRILALQTLYACEMGNTLDWNTVLDTITAESSYQAIVVTYARELLAGLYRSIGTIDELIQQRAANWDIKRMAVIDRNILRLATAELRCFPEVPAKVVIDEAVELAKSFGAEDSGKFVNGIIDSVHKNLDAHQSASGKDGSLHGTTTCQE